MLLCPLLVALLTALILLCVLPGLVNHKRLEQGERFISLRENYCRTIQREDRQALSLRRDFRRHLMAVQSLLEQNEIQKDLGYLTEIARSLVFGGRRSLFENENYNVCSPAKAAAT